jgi:hypothetical protein
MTERWVSLAFAEIVGFALGAVLGLTARRWRPYAKANNLKPVAFLAALTIVVGAFIAVFVWRLGPPTELSAPAPHAIEVIGAFLSSLLGFWVVSKRDVLTLLRHFRVEQR